MLTDNGGPSQLEHFLQENAKLRAERDDLRARAEACDLRMVDLMGDVSDLRALLRISPFEAGGPMTLEQDRWVRAVRAALAGDRHD